MKPWWDTCLINNAMMKKISLALRRGRQMAEDKDTDKYAKVGDDVPTIKRVR